eukprot:scaffold126132_cov69-Phaeocystis_antarctica.AAC.7
MGDTHTKWLVKVLISCGACRKYTPARHWDRVKRGEPHPPPYTPARRPKFKHARRVASLAFVAHELVAREACEALRAAVEAHDGLLQMDR